MIHPGPLPTMLYYPIDYDVFLDIDKWVSPKGYIRERFPVMIPLIKLGTMPSCAGNQSGFRQPPSSYG